MRNKSDQEKSKLKDSKPKKRVKAKSDDANNLAPVNSKDDLNFKQLVDSWLEICKMNGLSPETLKDYSMKLGQFYWWWSEHTKYAAKLGEHPRHLSTALAREFVYYLRTATDNRWGRRRNTKPLSEVSVLSYCRAVKTFFKWLEQEGHIPQTPFNKSVKIGSYKVRNTLIKSISKANLIKIFDVLTAPPALQTFTGVRDWAICSVLLDTGIRRGELLSMKISELDLAERRCSISGKTGKRYALFSPKCREIIVEYLKIRDKYFEKSGEDALWLGEGGVPLGKYGLNSIIDRIEKRANVKFSAHKFRHSYALMLSSKVSLFELKELLGHTTTTTTEMYTRNNTERLSEVQRKNSPLNVIDESLSNPLPKRRGRPRRQN